MIPIHLSAHWPGPWRESWNTGNHQPAGRLSILRKAELSQSWQWCSNLQNLTSAKLWATTWQRQVHMPLHMQTCHAIWQSQWASWFVSHMISLLLIELEAFWVPFVCLSSPFSEPSCAKLLDRRPSPQVGNEANCLLGLYALSRTNGARAAPLLDSNLTEPDLICSRCCVGCVTPGVLSWLRCQPSPYVTSRVAVPERKKGCQPTLRLPFPQKIWSWLARMVSFHGPPRFIRSRTKKCQEEMSR